MRHAIATTIFFLLAASSALAADGPWLADWQAARDKARKEGKPLVLVTLAPG